MEKIVITASDGYQLSALYAAPVTKNVGTVVISSATGVRKEFYLHFALFLVGQGYTVLLYDYRGIGGSAPNDLRKMDAFMHEWGTKDMNAVLDYLVREKGMTDIIWLGHSVGAQLIGFLEKPHYIRKVISINSALGYWRYFPFPMNWLIWGLWYFIGPLMVKLYGYGVMTKIGWGENLPRNMMKEWRSWCLNKTYFRESLRQALQSDQFSQFTIPITSVYMSDDFIANDKTVPLMLKFFPNSPQRIRKLSVREFTQEKVGHTGIFRKKFRHNLWPVLVEEIRK
ncbi:alpha/beta hydrolase family protein [Larkinella terrae]|uniref:Alpha/beta fold hydrolase n=1 Tax=Larkinella terrae TaxID=2025311 RepID=A0A7K0EGY1_9BACT|nr:alpha/beta fold hydrolase [Larkinella terrae]MRS61110.1 alpha/beta fold hydrolase [Larkinella terrae]